MLLKRVKNGNGSISDRYSNLEINWILMFDTQSFPKVMSGRNRRHLITSNGLTDREWHLTLCFHYSRYRLSTACTAETQVTRSKVWFSLFNFKTYFPLLCSDTNQFSFGQFIPSTDWVVMETHGTIQQISSSSLFCGRPSRELPAVQSLTLSVQHFLCRNERFRQSSR